MKNKYFILAFTLLCILVGQKSYSQDWQDSDDDWGWGGSDDDQSGWYNDEDFSGPEWQGGVVINNDYHAPDYSDYLNADLYDPYNYGYQPPQDDDDQQNDPPVTTPPTTPPTPPTPPDPEVCSLVTCSIPGYTVDREICECVPPMKAWYLDDDGDGYFATGVSAREKPEGNYTESTLGYDCDDTNPFKNVGSDCGYKMWYLDWDGDGYHSDTNESADSPGIGWVLTTLGVDCDENDPTKNVYCGNKMWYTDNDNDGWYGTLKSSENSPGPEWIDYAANPPKGQDCDDTKPSVNNICATIDDCAEIKKQLLNQKFKDIISALSNSNNLNLHHETGYWQDRAGEFHVLDVNGIRAVSMPDDISSLQNINHVHMNDWVNEQGVLEASYAMPSPADIAKVYSLYDNSRSNGMNLGNTYVGNISSLGVYQLRYTGVADNLSTSAINTLIDAIKSDENRTAYELSMFQNGDLGGLLIFIRDVLKRNDLALYKIDTSGASKIELDANNQIKITPCN